MADTDAKKAREILDALVALSQEQIWVSELRFNAGSSRADFWTLEPAASKGFRATAYEIKVSRADFKRDSEAKQGAALLWSDRFYYVTPPGLLSVSDLPEWAGMQEWDGSSMRVLRRAPKRHKAEPNWDLVVALLRGSADRGRDIGMLKAQLAFYQHREAEQERRNRFRNQHDYARWIAKSPSLQEAVE